MMAPAGQAIEGAFYGFADGPRRELQLLLTYVETQETQTGGLKSKTMGWLERLRALDTARRWTRHLHCDRYDQPES